MKDRWTELCEQAITELDPQKFRAILRELNELLDEEEEFASPQSESSPTPVHAMDRSQQASDRAA